MNELIEKIINLLIIGQTFLDEIDSFKFESAFFKSNTKYHGKKFIEYFEHDSNKMFDNMNNDQSVLVIYDIFNSLMKEIKELSISDKKKLLKLFQSGQLKELLDKHTLL